MGHNSYTHRLVSRRLVGRRLQQSVEVVGRVRPVDEPSRPQDGQREPGGAQVVLCGLLAGEDREEVEDGLVKQLVRGGR